MKTAQTGEAGARRPEKATRGDAKKKRAVSTARRMERGAFSQLVLLTLLVDALAVFLALCAWCYRSDSAYLGGETRLQAVFEGVDRQMERRPDGRIDYVMTAAGRPAQRVDATAFLELLRTLLFAALLAETVLLLLMDLVSRARIRRQLKPLNALAEAAQRLTRSEAGSAQRPQQAPAPQDGQTVAGGVRPESFQTLESAIGRISPVSPKARLQTGDASLAGLEEAINDLLDRMQAAYREQTRFVSDASHELRTPIAVVKGYADMLARWGRNDATVLDEGITAIQTETEHMSRLVEQLLFLARGDSGRTQLQFELLPLAALVQEVYEESEMIHPEHRWRFQSLGAPQAIADAAMLKQAVRILTDNAVKYTPPGETIRLRALENEAGQPCIEVQDSGIGISREDMAHVFERFFRADPARAADTGGTGLGLAIAKWIIDRHGGGFEMVSEPEIGTRITICLPKPETVGPA